MRVQTLSALASRLKASDEKSFNEGSLWLVREPSPWQPPEVNVRSTMPVLPNSALLAGRESLVYEVVPGAAGTPVTLGRTEGNDVVINDGTLSKRHLFFTRGEGGLWQVTDAGSFNGTTVDGVKLPSHTAHPVRDGALLKLGQIELTFHDTPGLLVRLRTTEGRPRGSSSSRPR